MSQKNEQLIRILKQAPSHCTGKELAAELGVSPRTVINYVNRINESREEPLILSDGTGYYLNRSASAEIAEDDDNIPQDRAQRMFYLLRLLLLSGDDGVDAFDLADELAISYSLLKKEISGFNALLQSYGIRICSRNNLITVEGEEYAKRKAVTALVQKYQGDVMLTMDILRTCFPDDIPDITEKILQEILEENSVYINDFSRLNLILHLSIVISRLRTGHALESEDTVRTTDNHSLPLSILKRIEETFRIRMNPAEKEQMETLIRSHIHLTTRDITDTQETELENFLKEVMEQVRTLYYLDLTDPVFLIPFSLHIKNLLLRLQKNIQIDSKSRSSIHPSLLNQTVPSPTKTLNNHDISTCFLRSTIFF